MLNVIQKVRETPCGPDTHIPGQDSVCSHQLSPLIYTVRKCSPGLFLLINLIQIKANKQCQLWAALSEKESQLSRDWPSLQPDEAPSHGLSGWCVILQASPCCPGRGAAAWGDGSLPGLRPSWEPSPAPCRSISPVQWPCPWQWYQTKPSPRIGSKHEMWYKEKSRDLGGKQARSHHSSGTYSSVALDKAMNFYGTSLLFVRGG